MDSLHHPLGGIGAHIARHAVEERCTESIHIGPGADIAILLVLFRRGKAGLQNGLGIVGNADTVIPHSAKVQQLHSAARQHHNVVRTDVPVNNARLVDPLQALHHRSEGIQHPFRAECTILLHIVLQRLTLEELHNDISSTILRKEVLNPDNLRYIAELCQTLGLPQKPLPVLFEYTVADVFTPGDHSCLGCVTHDKAIGIILFDGHRGLEELVKSHIGDTEAALAQHLTYKVLPLQHRTNGQLVRVILGALIKAAVLTERTAGLQIHAPHTPFLFHKTTLFRFICNDYITLFPPCNLFFEQINYVHRHNQSMIPHTQKEDPALLVRYPFASYVRVSRVLLSLQ